MTYWHSRTTKYIVLFVLSFTLGLLTPDQSIRLRAESPAALSAAQLLPPTTIAYAEIRELAQIIELVIDHPLSQGIQATDDFKKSLENKQYLQFKAGVAILEAQMEMPWRKLVARLTSEGIYAGFDAHTQGAMILARASDGELPAKLLSRVLELARLEAKSRGANDPVQTGEYRGLNGYKLGDAFVAVSGKWLVICNKAELGKVILDRLIDGGPSFAEVTRFQDALRGRNAKTNGWAFVDIERIRESGAAKNLFAGPVDNPILELMLGGIVANLQTTPFATLELTLTRDRQSFHLSAPFDPRSTGETREYYFGPAGAGRAPSPLKVANELFSLRTYRDVSTMWQRAGDLFNEQINEGFAKAESQLKVFFSGSDFAEDILGAMRPELQLVVVKQTFDDGQVIPAIQLPAFALTGQLKDPARMQPQLRRTFQNFFGFLSVVGAMDGQPQLEIETEKSEGRQLVTASYVPETGKKSQPTKIQYNFSPSILFTSDRFILSSTKKLAIDLAKSAESAGNASGTAAADESINTEARLTFAELNRVLQDNRSQLAAKNILEKGQTKEQAEREVDGLFSLLKLIDTSRIRLTTANQQLRFEFESSFAGGEKNK